MTAAWGYVLLTEDPPTSWAATFLLDRLLAPSADVYGGKPPMQEYTGTGMLEGNDNSFIVERHAR